MPPNAAATIQQAHAFIQAGRAPDAAALLAGALKSRPRDPDLHAALCDALGYAGDLPAAETAIRKAIQLRPGYAPYMQTLGDLLLTARRFDEAMAPLEGAMIASGGGPDARFTFAESLYLYGRFAQAADVAAAGLKKHPAHAGLLEMHGASLMQTGRADLAVDSLRNAAQRLPDHARLAALLATALNYPPGVDPAETFAAHQRAGRLIAAAAKPHAHPRPADPSALTRRLRVGFVSADLRLHACSFFFEPLLAGLDRDSFEITCYHVGEREDERSQVFRSMAHHWRHAPRDDAPALAARIRDDAIDVLIDLSGYTDGNRMPVFALRPAPVQLTYLGYPNTTGLPTIDGRIVDAITDPPPPSRAEQFATERLYRIDPCFLCYGGMPEAALAPAPPSAAGAGAPLTFGSFNALLKLNDPLIALWARAMNAAAPGSRIVLKYRSLGEPAAQAAIRERFARAGITADRLVLLPATDGYREHLESYSLVDIALDSFPYHGTTTTCEALWMGVPVVTLGSSPDVHASRVGISLLHAVGLPDLVARDESDFVRISASLAADRARLADLRTHLRARMLASPLCDRAAFGRRFGAVIRGAWQDWCRSAPV